MTKIRLRLAVLTTILLVVTTSLHADEPAPLPGKTSDWNGFVRYDFEVDGKPVLVVTPKVAAAGKPWVWHGEFFGHKPAPDIALLGRGFHVVYMSVPNMLGAPPAVEHWNKFYAELTGKFGFAKQPALAGLSRGGLYCYNWAAANPEKVACIYGDVPVCDFKSWPGGKGKAKGSAGDWKLILDLHGFKNDAEALAYTKNPVDNLEPLAKAKVPLLHVYGDADEVVPWEENTGLIAERYAKLGGSITLIAKKGVGHHPHGLEDSTPIVEFIAKHASGQPTPRELLEESKRVLFLGDSITASGQYVAWFDAWLTGQRLKSPPTLINMGLPSETVSGLSEDGHAGGAFPRPDLAERLARVLATAKPDLVIACYGMNCGIYEPLSGDRFSKYQRGWKVLREEVDKSGARIIAVTPPFYDDLRSPRAFSYNEVLDRYSEWLLERRKNDWVVIDLHGPMTREVKQRRASEPKFTFQPDGVHPNEAGHWFVAQQLIAAFGDPDSAKAESPQEMVKALKLPAEVLSLVQQRANLRRDAYVSAAGHKRPGVAKGLPIEEAEQKGSELTGKIQQLLDAK